MSGRSSGRAGLRPGSPLAAATTRRSARYRLPVFVDLAEARWALAGRVPLTDQIRLNLPPLLLRSVVTAEQLVAELCPLGGSRLVEVGADPARFSEVADWIFSAVMRFAADRAMLSHRTSPHGRNLERMPFDRRLVLTRRYLVRREPGDRDLFPIKAG